MSRKIDSNTRYRVYIHSNKKYRYAAVQIQEKNKETNKLSRKIFHIGTIDENLVFTPNISFLLMDVKEREKYIFPKEWNISKALPNNIVNEKVQNNNTIDDSAEKKEDMSLNNENLNLKTDVKASDLSIDQYNNRLYGAFWLLEQIFIKIGLYEDLMAVFNNNEFKVNEILTLSIFPYLSGKNYCRFAKWQKTHKTSIDYHLTSSSITRISQTITDNDRMRLIKLRLQRQPKNAIVDCDSTTRSAWGKCLVDIRWGKNKDNPKLKNTTDVIVYSLTTHEPIYYRLFPGFSSDMSTVRTILSDLRALEIKDLIFITDRGYVSEENITTFVAIDLPFIMAARVDTNTISKLLLKINYESTGYPINMKFNKKNRLFSTQMNVEPYLSHLSDGTEIQINGLKANLFLDLRKRMDEISFIYDKINEEKNILDNDIKLKIIPGNMKKYKALFPYFRINEIKDENENIIGFNYSENSEKITKEISKCGFFASLMYKLDITSEEALNKYKSRDEHEKNFDQFKNQLNFNLQRNSSEDGKNGRSFFAFIGLICISVLRKAWKISLHDKYQSTLDMLDEMESIRYSEYLDGSSHMTTFTMKQVEICNACGVKPPFDCLPQTLKK